MYMYLILFQQVMGLALPRSEAQAHVCLPVRDTPGWVLLQQCIMLRLFFIIECGIVRFLCIMRALEVRASSSSPGYPCAKFHFFRASIAELAHGE